MPANSQKRRKRNPIQAYPETRDKLKAIAAFENKTMGQLLDEWAAQRYAELQVSSPETFGAIARA